MTDHEPPPSAAALAAHLRSAISGLVRATRPTDQLAPSPAAVLDLLDTRGPLTTAELAAARGVRHQTMAATVKDLTDTGHLTAGPDPADARKKLLALTPAGGSAIRAERHRRVARLADAVDVALDDADRRTLARALELVDRITDVVAERRPAGPDGQPLTGDW
ncbi:MarR family winged helix-turn-helix transcriptional regulator [Cellulomonas alba]|uniref:MarR family winged helix-turn-helix transcriptional regulator n=1 Tax=Cellulomonas alba TaxID=3053467 RepID=A0ABT7SGM4_9CELL|nr:MarR family winged helix-turn-helix transcriptional regulator [Cellulomonas alba]MDM7855340.1 MarR family winged helix-turn-helix transcriptional regulator [Cellulomonas alba]